MTNAEAYLLDLKDLDTAVAGLLQAIPEGETKRAKAARDAAERLASDARATIACMTRDYIVTELDGSAPAPRQQEQPASAFRYDMTLLSRASFPAELEEGGRPCIVEVTVYRLNAVAVNSFLLEGATEAEDIARHFLGVSDTDTYMTRHKVDDLLTVVRVLGVDGKERIA